MADFNGKFQYLDNGGQATQEGHCRVSFDDQTFTLSPESGTPLVFDLGDIDAVIPADWEIRVALYTGRTLLLRQFGKAYDTLAHNLLEAYKKRTLQCLLLEDLEEIERFDATFALSGDGIEARSGTAELRLYKSNLAVLAATSQSFQWRLADVDDLRLNAANYEVVIEAGTQRLRITKLAKRTEEFAAKTREAMNALAAQSSQALHTIFPFLDPDQLQSAAGVLREGHAAPLTKLAAIHNRISAALNANAVDADLKPYYESLASRTAEDLLYAGFKLIRQEDTEAPAEDPSSDDEPSSGTPDAGSTNAGKTNPGKATEDILYWFFFPIATKPGAKAANVVAWEASSRSGRATYFFHLFGPAEASQLKDTANTAASIERAIFRLNRVLGMLNFRRRPIYLSDDALAMDPQYHRYAISARRLPELREVRASFLGRAIHSSPAAWQAQVDEILSKAGR